MPKAVSTSEAKNKFSEMVSWVREYGDEVVVESRGAPTAVIMSFEEYEKLRGLREQARRREVLARLEKLRERVQATNSGITNEEAEAIADRFSREVITEMIEEDKVKYEGK